MNVLAPYYKAIIAFFAPGAVLIGTAVTDASPGGERITGGEWVTALVACIVTAAAVYGVPNRPADYAGEHREGGHAAVSFTVVLFAMVVVFAVALFLLTRDASAPQAILGKAILGKA